MSTMSVDHELCRDHRYVQLDVLTRDLRHELDSLNHQLRQLVNDSFDEFVLLGKSINLDTADAEDGPDLAAIRHELTHYATTVKQNQQLIAQLAQTARAVVAHRRRLIAIKTSAKMGLIINDLVATFDKLLADPHPPTPQLIGVYLSIKLTYAQLEPQLPVAQVLRLKVASVTQEFTGFLATLPPAERVDVTNAITHAELTSTPPTQTPETAAQS